MDVSGFIFKLQLVLHNNFQLCNIVQLMIHIALVLDVLQDINLIMEFVSQLHLKYVEQFQIVLIKIQLIVFVLHVLVVSLTINPSVVVQVLATVTCKVL